MLPIYDQENTAKKAESVFKDNSTDGHLGVWYERFYTYHIFDNQGDLIPNPDAKKKLFYGVLGSVRSTPMR